MSETRRQTAHELIETIPLVMRTLAAELRRSGHVLMPAHIATLGMLQEQALNLTELAERLVVSRPTASKLISNLQQRGWVERVRSVDDRRVVSIALTPAGADILFRLMRDAEVNVAAHLAALSTSECDKLRDGLAVMRAVFQAAYDAPTAD